MGKIFWLNIHTIIFLLLVIGKFIEEVGQGCQTAHCGRC